MIDYASEKPVRDSSIMFFTTYKTIMLSKLSYKKKLEAIATFLDFGFYDVDIPDSDEHAVLSAIYMSNKNLFVSMKKKHNKQIEAGATGGAPIQTKAKDVIKLKNDGLSNKDIAEQLGCSERTVERKLKERREAQPHKAESIPTQPT